MMTRNRIQRVAVTILMTFLMSTAAYAEVYLYYNDDDYNMTSSALTVYSPIDFSGSSSGETTITKIDIGVNIDHNNLSDLQFTLIKGDWQSPVYTASATGNDADDSYSATYDNMSSLIVITDIPSTVSPYGSWYLAVFDMQQQNDSRDLGRVDRWRLGIVYTANNPPTPNPSTWETAPYGTGTDQISMTLDEATDPEGSAVEYRIEFVSGGSGGSTKDWNGTRSYTDYGLTANTRYTYSGSARDTDEIETTPVSTSAYTLQPEPGASVITRQATSVTLRATNVYNVSSGSSGVQWNAQSGYGSDDQGFTQSTDYTDTGLEPDRTYTYRCQSRNGDGIVNSAYEWSSTTSFTTLAAVPPAPVVATNDGCTVTVDVQPGTNPDQVQYAVYSVTHGMYLDGSGNLTNDATWLTDTEWATVTLDEITIGQLYEFKVKARNSLNEETDFSPVASTTTATTWTAASSPYRVTGTVTVPSGNTLTIEPGVDVFFDAVNAQIKVEGTLLTLGTETDSVRFLEGTEQWAGIDIRPGASATLQYTSIRDAKGGGGLGANNANLNMSHCVIKRCSPNGGLGISNSADVSVEDCSFLYNDYVSYGGAARVTGGSTAEFERCMFLGNTSNNGGGALWTEESVTTIRECIFRRNNVLTGAQGGGGMYGSGSGTIVIDGCEFTNNDCPATTSMAGGGIYIRSDVNSATITHCTIASNSAPTGGGVALDAGVQNVTIENSIIYDLNPVAGTPTITYSCIRDGYSGTGNISSNPLFADSANDDYHLTASSPCIGSASDGGDMGAFPYEQLEFTSSTGHVSDTASVSIKAIFHTPKNSASLAFTTNSTIIDSVTLTFSAFDGLVEAQSTCNMHGDTVFVGLAAAEALSLTDEPLADLKFHISPDATEGAYPLEWVAGETDLDDTTPALYNGSLNITEHVNRAPVIDSLASLLPDGKINTVYETPITASDPDGDHLTYEVVDDGGLTGLTMSDTLLTHSSPENAGTYMVQIRVADTGALADTVTLALKITSGVEGAITTTTWTAENSPYRVTGTVTVPSGNTLTIEAGVDVLFDADVQFVVEGAIHAHGVEGDSVRFIKGTADEWGGIRISGGQENTFAYTRVSDGHPEGSWPQNAGGGIWCEGSNTRLVMDHCTISGNTAGGHGGGLHTHNDAEVELSHCVINGNSATGDGGGIRAAGINATLTNCTFYGNKGNISSTVSGASGTTKLKNCILWNEATQEIYGSVTATYSCIKSSYTGTGNISSDPLFSTHPDSAYHLTLRSPCIDAGDPSSPNDSWGTRADMGAYAYPQYQVNVTAGEGGSVTPESGYQKQGEVIEISATPDIGYVFTGWTGTGSGSYTGTNNPASVTVTGPITQTANFEPGGTITTDVTWTAADSPARIAEEVTVTSGATLTIEPGVDILFDADVAITVEGVLRALGTADDSVRFLPGTESEWGGLRFAGSDSSTLRYVQIHGAVSDDDGGGVRVAETARLGAFHTRITENRTTGNGGGLAVVGTARAWMNYTILAENDANDGAAAYAAENAIVKLLSCILTDNEASIGANGICVAGNADVELHNSVVWEGNEGISGTVTAAFSDIQQASGVHTGTGNLNTDPLFSSHADSAWHLKLSSPCIDAGDPESGKDPDSTRADMGALPAFLPWLTVTTGPGGAAVTPANAARHTRGESVEISATPEIGYVFTGWTGEGNGSYTGTDNPATVTMNGPITQTANFTWDGTIITQTWTSVDSPVRIAGTVTIPSGNTLTIGAGVDVLFDADAQFIVRGALDVNGTATDSVRFLKGTASEWGGIRISGGQQNVFEYTRISDGNADGSSSPDNYGGGIYCTGSDTRLQMKNCVVKRNSAVQDGAGIECTDGAHLDLLFCQVRTNTASYSGGGLRITGASSADLTSCVISENRGSFSGAGAGVVVESSDISMTDCSIMDNGLGIASGAGMYVHSSSTGNFTDCTFRRNNAGDNGGALVINQSAVTLDHCTLANNSTADDGGAVDVENSATASFDYCIISGNSAERGGGICVVSSNATVSNCTFVANTSTIGGAVFANSATVSVTNTIFWENTPEITGITDITFSSCEESSFPGTGNISGDPLFVDAANGDYSLQSTSPCINTGDPSSNLDPDGTIADMGAIPFDLTTEPYLLTGMQRTRTLLAGDYHVPNTVTVLDNSTLTIEAGVDVLFDADVQFVVEGAIHAHGVEGDSVRFIKGAADEWGGIRISGGDSSSFAYTRVSDGNADGSWPSNTGGAIYCGSFDTRISMNHSVISGNNATTGGGGIFVCENATATFADCLIRNNSASSGGGIYNYGPAKVVLTNCAIRNNSALSSGGGFQNSESGATATLIGCTIVDGSAIFGGGLYNSKSAIVALNNCSIQDNITTVTGGTGAGVYNYDGSTAELTECIFAGNVSEDDGGATFNKNATLHIENSTFFGNQAQSDNNGGMLHNTSEGTAVIRNCIIWGNRPNEIYNTSGSVTISYSSLRNGLVTSITDGGGNISFDPLFVDSTNGDYSLQSTSPCINTGDPSSNLDPDGTIADMGAIPFDLTTEPYLLTGMQRTRTLSAGQYHVPNTVTVLDDSTLTIEAGVDVLFDADVQFVVEGAIHAHGVEGDSVRFIKGTADEWGGIRISGGQENTFSYTRVSDGNADGSSFPNNHGGGIFCTESYTRLLMDHCTISRNSAQYGGGLCNDATTILTNCTIRANSATEHSGGLYNRNTTTTLTNCTVNGNSASSGGAIDCGAGQTTLTSCILWGDSPQEIYVFSGTATATYSCIQSGYTGEGNISSDPLFVDAANGNYSLQSTSPCINTGDPSSNLDPDGTIADMGAIPFDLTTEPNVLTGMQRTRTLSAGQYHVPNTVTVLDDSTLTTEAGVDVLFDADVQFVVEGAIHAHGVEGDSVRFIKGTASEWGGIRISGGDSSSFAYTRVSDVIASDYSGGAIYVKGETDIAHPCIRMSNTVIRNNHSMSGADGGGIIGRDYARIWMDRCIVDHNRANCTGGGLQIFNYAQVYIDRSIISSNTSTYSETDSGGGIVVYYDGLVDLQNSIVWGNSPYDLLNNGTSPAYSGTVSARYSVINVLYDDTTESQNTYRHILDLDPHFADTTNGNYSLQSISPCINTGDPSGSLDPDGTIADMGAIPFDLTTEPYLLTGMQRTRTLSAGQYHVPNTVTVLDDSILTIEAGVDVLFDADVQFVVEGAIHAHGVEGDSVRFIKGAADEWGGIRISGGDSSSFAYTRVSDGNADAGSNPDNYGGGISASDNGTTLFLDHSVVSGNKTTGNGANGGGLSAITSSRIRLKHSLVTSNNADGAGGAVYTYESSCLLHNCTLTANTADDGGGGVFDNNAQDTLLNCIVWNNSPIADQIALYSSEIVASYSCIQNGYTGTGNISSDPLFADAANGDYHLTASSPCIDTGDSSSPDDPDGTRADMGAFYFSQTHEPPEILTAELPPATERVPYSTLIYTSDFEKSSLTFSLLDPSPDWLSFTDVINDSVGVLIGTPSQSDTTSGDTVTVRVEDGQGLTDTAVFILAVNDTNYAPEIVDLPATLSGREDSLFSVVFTVKDIDSDSVTMTFAPDTGEVVFRERVDSISTYEWTWHPGYDDAETYLLQFTATDVPPDGLTSESTQQTMTVTVDSTNRAPVWTFLPDTSCYEGDILDYIVTATDPDGESLTLNLAQPSPDDATFTPEGQGSSRFHWEPGYDLVQEGSAEIGVTFRADDGNAVNGRTDSTITITVHHENLPPQIITEPDILPSATDRVPYEVHIYASDFEKTSLTFSLLDPHPEWLSFMDGVDDSVGVLIGTPSQSDTTGGDTVTVRVEDGQALADTAVFILAVNDTNYAPTISSGFPTETVEGMETDSIGFNFVISDGDLDSVVVSVTPDTGDVSFVIRSVEAESLLTFHWGWRPGLQDSGSYNLQFTIVDVPPEGLNADSVQTTVNVHVENFNTPPVWAARPDTFTNENQTLTFTVHATDEDNGPQLLEYDTVYAPTGTDFNSSTQQFSWTPTFLQAGEDSVIFSVTDGQDTVYDTVCIDVIDVNRPPQISTTDLPDATERHEYTAHIEVYDPDTDNILTPALLDTPAWVENTSWNVETMIYTLSGTPQQSDITPGVNIEFEIRDNWDSVRTETFTIAVNDTNYAPTISSGFPTETIEGMETDTVGFDFVISDGDLDSVVVSVTPDTGDVSFVIRSVEAESLLTFHWGWRPGLQDSGSYNLQFTIVDVPPEGLNADSVQTTVNVHVENFNTPPVWAARPDTFTNENQTLTFTVHATDEDNGPQLLEYDTVYAPTGTDFNSSTQQFSWTPTFLQAGEDSVIFSATDGHDTVLDTVIITVMNVNRPPEWTSDTKIEAKEDDLKTYTATANDLDPEQTLIFGIVGDLPSGAAFDEETATLRWTPDYDQAGRHTVTFSVHDGDTTIQQDIVIDVENTNRAPVWTLLPDTSCYEGDTLDYIVTAEDDDGNPLTLSLVQPSPDSAKLISEGQGRSRFHWVPGYDLVQEDSAEFQVTFLADDDSTENGQTDSTITITVHHENLPPHIITEPDTLSSATDRVAYSTLIYASDFEKSSLTFSLLDPHPEWLSFAEDVIDDSVGVLSGTPSQSDTSSGDTVTVRVEDGQGLADTTVFILAVIDTNYPPEIVDLPATLSGREDSLFSVVFTVKDIDSDSVTMTFAPDTGEVVFRERVDSISTYEWTWHPGYDDAETYLLQFTATDVPPDGLTSESAQQTMTVTVDSTNRAPVWTFLPDTSCYEGDILDYIVTATDPDGESLTLNLVQPSPDDATVTPEGQGSSRFLWEPGYDLVQEGSAEIDVTFRADDGNAVNGRTDSTITITVHHKNLPPQIITIDLPDATERQAYTAYIEVDDPDTDDILTPALLDTPAWIENTLWNAETKTYTLSGTPGQDDTTSAIDITFRIADNHDSVRTKTFTIAVNDTNYAPEIVDLPATLSGREDSLFSVEFTVKDIDSDSVTLTFAPDTGEKIFRGRVDSISTYEWTWRPGYDDAGDYPLQFTATDKPPKGLTAAQVQRSVNVHVENKNQPPCLDPLPKNQTSVPGHRVSFTISATDPDGDDISSYEMVSGPYGAVFNTTNKNMMFSWIRRSNQEDSARVVFRVKDCKNDSADTTIDISAGTANSPPIITVGNMADTVSWTCSLLLTVTDANRDLSILSAFIETDGMWEPLTVSGDTGSTIDEERNLTWNSCADINSACQSDVRLKFLACDVETTETFHNVTILNLACDWDSSGYINLADFCALRDAWGSDTTGGKSRVDIAGAGDNRAQNAPNLTGEPDGKIDFEDFVGFMLLYNWAWDRNRVEHIDGTCARLARQAVGTGPVSFSRTPESRSAVDIRLNRAVNPSVMALQIQLPKHLARQASIVRGSSCGSGTLWISRCDTTTGILTAWIAPEFTGDGNAVARIEFQRALPEIELDMIYEIHRPGDAAVLLGAMTQTVDMLPLPTQWNLTAAPNPFNPCVTVRFDVPEESPVKISVYNTLGQRVTTLADRQYTAGRYAVSWDGRDANGRDAGSGVYLLRLETPGMQMLRRVTMIR